MEGIRSEGQQLVGRHCKGLMIVSVVILTFSVLVRSYIMMFMNLNHLYLFPFENNLKFIKMSCFTECTSLLYKRYFCLSIFCNILRLQCVYIWHYLYVFADCITWRIHNNSTRWYPSTSLTNYNFQWSTYMLKALFWLLLCRVLRIVTFYNEYGGVTETTFDKLKCLICDN